ncbi:membrane protein involved in the export of O-antigen and teichoic acid [Rivularia sp. PCC 7116]|uniref:lipopolysaccharide biosynthesis protein n=1 Tax=Rivularia sp. PCC 7116 TaxID=373994 RepID=UPI00029EF953|nr:lipopolysaccharide biosynthesis protein [Rivularia sp. PCC 7116]AFY56612.1 membrane protein involved in the export of O-antigen and teichoic acid [Rivularia sp. PCC 7116]
MNSLNAITRYINKKISSQFIRNLGWLGIAEICYRVLRLGLVVITARYLTPHDYGLGAIILAVREFAITFADVGIGAKIIQAEEKELPHLCSSAFWLNWVIFASLFMIQAIASFPIASVYRSKEIIFPIIVSGIAYLIWPIYGIQKTLIQRENRFKVIAFTDTIQFSIAGVLTAIFAVMGMGVWAFALPIVLVAPLEIIIYYKYHSWRPKEGFTTLYWDEILSFGKNILGVGLLKTLRNNLDYLIVGRLISVEDLGIYFFGFNAGLGISLSIINAISSVMLPHLCEARMEWSEFKHRYLHSIRTIAMIIVPFVLLQSSLAPIYVPIVFGEKWIPAIPILIIVCLSAIPRPFANAASQLLIAIGKPHLDLWWNVIFTSLFGVFLLIGASSEYIVNTIFDADTVNSLTLMIGENWQVIGIALAVLLVHLIFLPFFTLWATRYVFPKKV